VTVQVAAGIDHFPGLQVRFGNSTDRLPACGCDACGETADGEVARFEELIEDVTAGRFREYFDRYESDGEWVKRVGVLVTVTPLRTRVPSG
jgi:hypothetical protein